MLKEPINWLNSLKESKTAMIESIKDIIDDVLDRLETVRIPKTEEAAHLVFETGMAESGYRHLEQIGGGPGISFWQMEIGTCMSQWENYILYRKPYIELMYSMGLVEKDLTFCILTNIALAAAFCRIYYWRKPEQYLARYLGVLLIGRNTITDQGKAR